MLIWSIVLVVLIGAAPIWSSPAQGRTSEALHRRNVFWVGGQYFYNATRGGTILVNQTYVEQLTPVAGVKQPYPLVFLHGGGDSGAQWLNKPDGNSGWATYFLEKGYEVFIVDTWSVGRSTPQNVPALSFGLSTEAVESAFTAPEKPKNYFQAQFHTQWPGTGMKGDPIFDAFFASLLPLIFSPTWQSITQTSICALLRRIGPSIFISHSVGTSVGLLGADACPDLVKGHVTAEGDQTPFANYDILVLGGSKTPTPSRPWGIADIPITYDPPVTNPSQLVRNQIGKIEFTKGLLSKYSCIIQADDATHKPRKLVNIAKSPILYLTGQASSHILYNQCSVQFLRQAGVSVTWTKLEDIGILGNGHFSMLEKNSDEIATYIEKWLKKIK